MTENEAIMRVKEFWLHHAIGDLPNSVLTAKAFEMAIKALEEIQQYRPIGTVEECQEACEKCTLKPPIRSKRGVPPEMITTVSACPECGIQLYAEFKPRGFSGTKVKCCYNCGQAIDWGDYNG